MSTPLLSICIPAYNRPEFLKDLLKSIVKEDFSDYESMDKKSMNNVRKFIQEFVDANGLNLHKEEVKK